MKTMFVNAVSDVDVRLSKAALAELKGRIGVCTTIQHLHRIKDVLAQLPGSVLVGQVLGCRVDNVKKLCDDVDAFLYVGTGEFHPVRVALEADDKPVFVYNPISRKLAKLGKEAVLSHRKRVMGALNRFYHAKIVGLLVTTKVGQNNGVISKYSVDAKMRLPLEFAKRTDRKYYIFAFDTLNHDSLQDFTFIDCWVNFACNRIMDDKNNRIVNVQDIIEAENG
jgi:2-(3-amino-3-carboxypropyl)histidine synthase